MRTFWLRYTNGATTNTLRLGAAEITYREETTRLSGRTLRGRQYGHRLYTGRSWNVVIYPSMLNYDITIFRNIHKADRIEYNPSSSTSTPSTGWVEVFLPTGEEPFERADGIAPLNIYTFKFVANSFESGA